MISKFWSSSVLTTTILTLILSLDSLCWAREQAEESKSEAEAKSEASFLTPKTTQYYLGVGQDVLLGFTGYGGARFMLTKESGLNVNIVLYTSPNLGGISTINGRITSGPTPSSLEVSYDRLFLNNSLYVSAGLIESNGNFLASAASGPPKVMDSIGPSLAAMYGNQFVDTEARLVYYHAVRKNDPLPSQDFLKYFFYAGYKPIPILSFGPFYGVYRSFIHNSDGSAYLIYNLASRVGGRIKLTIPQGLMIDISAGVDTSSYAKANSIDGKSNGEWYTMYLILPFTI